MDLFSLITLIGGLAFFLYGMHVMSSGLEKLAGGKLEKTLRKMTSNPFKSLLLGAGITIAIQSSSAMTVMLVGLVNSGIMQLGQTVGVIMGSNIGTTLTAWILSLSGIQSDVFWLRLLKPENFSPIFAMVGVTLIMASKSTRRKDVGSILVGFSVLMFGMNLMSSAVSPLADVPEFANLLIVFKNPLVGVLVGTVFTGIIQSSAASVGILQALSLTGGISYGMAIPIIMGQNIGTCVTALLSSIGVNKNAKRVAIVHISFNIIGTILCLSVFYGVNALFPLPFIDNPIDGVGIAAVHSIFNIVTTAVLLPFPKQLEKLANMVVREGHKDDRPTFLDELLLRTPSIAVNESRSMTVRMANLARTSVLQAVSLFDTFDHKAADQILENESTLDWFEDQLGTYLLKLSGKELSDADSRQVSKIFLTIGDFERLGDHAVNLAKTARELFDKRLQFSAEAQHEGMALPPVRVDKILLLGGSQADKDHVGPALGDEADSLGLVVKIPVGHAAHRKPRIFGPDGLRRALGHAGLSAKQKERQPPLLHGGQQVLRQLHARHLAGKGGAQQLCRQNDARPVGHHEVSPVEQGQEGGVVERELGHLGVGGIDGAAARGGKLQASADRLLHGDVMNIQPADGNVLHEGHTLLLPWFFCLLFLPKKGGIPPCGPARRQGLPHAPLTFSSIP